MKKNERWILDEHFNEVHIGKLIKTFKKEVVKSVEHQWIEDKFIGLIFNKYFFNQVILLSQEQRDLLQSKLDKILTVLKVMKSRDENFVEVVNFIGEFLNDSSKYDFSIRRINYMIDPFEVIDTEDYYLKDVPELKLCLLRAPSHWSITYKIQNKVVQSFENIGLVVAITENLQNIIYHAGTNKFEKYRLKLGLDKNLATKPKPEKMRIAKI